MTHESIRNWCRKFGADFAGRLRRRRPKPGDTWHLDEVFIRINGVLHYLWRAVDQHGVVLDILVQGRRNAAAAKRFFKRLLHGLKYKPRRLITDGLRSYGAAHREVLPDVRHRTSRYLTDIFDKPFSPSHANFHIARATAWRRAGIGMRARRVPYDERFPFAAPVHPAGLVCQLATKRV